MIFATVSPPDPSGLEPPEFVVDWAWRAESLLHRILSVLEAITEEEQVLSNVAPWNPAETHTPNQGVILDQAADCNEAIQPAMNEGDHIVSEGEVGNTGNATSEARHGLANP